MSTAEPTPAGTPAHAQVLEAEHELERATSARPPDPTHLAVAIEHAVDACRRWPEAASGVFYLPELLGELSEISTAAPERSAMYLDLARRQYWPFALASCGEVVAQIVTHEQTIASGIGRLPGVLLAPAAAQRCPRTPVAQGLDRPLHPPRRFLHFHQSVGDISGGG